MFTWVGETWERDYGKEITSPTLAEGLAPSHTSPSWNSSLAVPLVFYFSLFSSFRKYLVKFIVKLGLFNFLPISPVDCKLPESRD